VKPQLSLPTRAVYARFPAAANNSRRHVENLIADRDALFG
jgi:hypothetical protein